MELWSRRSAPHEGDTGAFTSLGGADEAATEDIEDIVALVCPRRPRLGPGVIGVSPRVVMGVAGAASRRGALSRASPSCRVCDRSWAVFGAFRAASFTSLNGSISGSWAGVTGDTGSAGLNSGEVIGRLAGMEDSDSLAFEAHAEEEEEEEEEEVVLFVAGLEAPSLASLAPLASSGEAVVAIGAASDSVE